MTAGVYLSDFSKNRFFQIFPKHNLKSYKQILLTFSVKYDNGRDHSILMILWILKTFHHGKIIGQKGLIIKQPMMLCNLVLQWPIFIDIALQV